MQLAKDNQSNEKCSEPAQGKHARPLQFTNTLLHSCRFSLFFSSRCWTHFLPKRNDPHLAVFFNSVFLLSFAELSILIGFLL